MYLLYKVYGPHTTKYVVYAAIVTALHEIIDLKHRSPHFRLDPLKTIPVKGIEDCTGEKLRSLLMTHFIGQIQSEGTADVDVINTILF